MKKRVKLKKFISLLLCFLIASIQMPFNIKAVGGRDIIITGYKADRDVIYKGVKFNLTVNFRNITGDELTNCSLILDAGSSYIPENGFYETLGNLGKGSSISKTIPLIYNGGDSKLQFEIAYTKNSTSTEERTPLSVNLNTYQEDNTPSTPVDTSKYVPKIDVENMDMPEGKAGGVLSFNLKFSNVGAYEAKNIYVTPVMDEGVLEAKEMILTKNIGAIKYKDSAFLNFSFKVKSSAVPKTYPITFKYNYTNTFNNEFKGESTIYVRVIPGNASGSLEVENLNVNPTVLDAGGNAKVNFSIVNEGVYFTKNIKVYLDGLNEKAFTLNSGYGARKIGFLNGNSSKQNVSFDINADEKMSSGNYPLKVKVEYTDNENNNKVEEQEFFIKVNSKKSSNIVSVQSVTLPKKAVSPGQSFELAFDVVNLGTKALENVTVSVDGGDRIIPKSHGYEVIESLKEKDRKKLSFLLMPNSNAEAKNHLINIEVKSSDGTVLTKQLIGVEVGQKSDIFIGEITPSSYVVAPNEKFNVDFYVENRGIGTAKNVKIFFEGGDGIISVGKNVSLISSLKPGEKRKLSFNVKAAPNAETKNYPITICAQYDSSKDNLVKETGYVYIQKITEGTNKSVPKIIIYKYNTEPKVVKAGSTFNINVSFLNTNRAKTVQNIKIFLTVDEKSSETGNVFTPVESSNTFYIDSISPKGVVTKSLKLYAIPDAKPKTYEITANIEYEDDKGNPYTAKELIGVPVYQPSQLKTSEPQLPEQLFVGQPNPVSVQFFNTGKVIMNNLMAKAEGNFALGEGGNYFVGNFEPGASDNFEFQIIPNAPGEVKGTISFSYDEPNGEHKVVKREIKVNAVEAPPVDNPPGTEDQKVQGGKLTSKKKIGIVVGVVGVLAVAGIIVVRKRKKKKGMSEDE